MFSFIFLIAAAIYLFYRWFTSDYDYFKKRSVAGPTPKFPFGNVPNAFTQKRNFLYDIDDIYQQFRQKAPFVGYFEGGKPKLLIIDPKIVKTVFITKFSSFQNNEFSRLINKESDPIFGRNPFMLRDDEWKEKRAEVTPAFTASRIRALFPLIEEVLTRFSKYINDELKKNTKEPVDAREISAKFTTDAVSSCIFNADAQSFTKEKPEIREAGRKLIDFSDKFVQLQFILLSLFPSIAKVWKVRFVSKELEGFFLNLMTQAIELREKTKITRDDYLAHLINLKNKKELSELDMAAHGVTFFIDGFETSSNAICHAFYELGNNKKVQTKLREQINKDLIDSDGKIIYDKMLEHQYLDQVFYETLRMHPPLGLYNRECSEDVILEDENGKSFKVEKGFSINVPIMAIQNDPEYYQHPDEFIPERFDPENGGVKEFYNRGVLAPFGDGPRICLGRNFAMMQSKAAIVEIVRKFEISVNIKTQRPLIIDETNFINVKKGGLWLDFKPL